MRVVAATGDGILEGLETEAARRCAQKVALNAVTTLRNFMPSTVMRWLVRLQRFSGRFGMFGWRRRCPNNLPYNGLSYYLHWISKCGWRLVWRCYWRSEWRTDLSGARGIAAWRFLGVRAACRQQFAVVVKHLKGSLGKLPRRAGWQPALPRNHAYRRHNSVA
jgi:hypothetical protein